MEFTKVKSLFLFLMISVTSCGSKNAVLERDINEFQNSLPEIKLSSALEGKLSGFIEEVQILQLDTTINSLVAMASDVIFDNGAIFILDTHKSKAIYSFDIKGSLNYKISRYGKGPGEYTLLQTISTYDDRLIAWAADKRKFLYFYKHTGEFIEEVSVDGEYLISSITHTMAGDMVVVNDNFSTVDKSNSLYLLDSALSIKETLNDSEEMSSGFIVPALAISKSNENNPIYKHPLHDVIYEVKEREIIPKYRLALPESELLTEEDLLLEDEILFKKINLEQLYFQSYITLHSPSYVSIGLIKGHDLNHGLLYSKKTKRVLDYSKLNNDVFDFDLPVPIATYQDYMVFVIEPEGVEELDNVIKEGAEGFVLPNSSRTVRGNLGLVFIKFKF